MTKNKNESGRTMLEMLGVLAIMGVIMYGAIAGIGFGVNMYKINATFNDAEELSQGIIDLYSWSRGYPDSETIRNVVIENDVLSGASALDGEGGGFGIQAPFGMIMIMSDATAGANDGERFGLLLQDLPAVACSRLQIMSYAHMDVIPEGETGNSKGYGVAFASCGTDCSGNYGTVCLMLR